MDEINYTNYSNYLDTTDQKIEDYTPDTAGKLLTAATHLFALYGYDAVSVKQITSMAGVNAALISYYYKGKKNLYLQVLNVQMEEFRGIINTIQSLQLSPRKKLSAYVEALIRFQENNPNKIHLIYRELLSPQPMFDNFVKNKLYMLHTFMTNLVDEAIKQGELKTKIAPTHVAFTLEGIILFYFLMHREIQELGNFKEGEEENYLHTAIDSYLASMK